MKATKEHLNKMMVTQQSTQATHERSLMPLLYVFLSGLGFSTQTLILKLLMNSGFQGAFPCVFSRGLFQMITCSVVMYFESSNQTPIFGGNSQVRWILLLRSVFGFGGIAFAFLALERLPVGDATVLVMLSPFVAAIASALILKESYTLPDFLATCVSIVGVILIARPQFIFGTEDDATSSIDPVGVLFALTSSFCAGFAYLFVRMLGTVVKMPWSNVCFSQGIGQVVLSIPSLYIAHEVITLQLTNTQWLLLFLVGSIGTYSQILMTIGMQREKSASATAMRMSDVVFSYGFQVAFTGDSISLLSIIGACIVSLSVFLVVIFKQPAAPSPVVVAVGGIETENSCELDLDNTIKEVESSDTCPESERSLHTPRSGDSGGHDVADEDIMILDTHNTPSSTFQNRSLLWPFLHKGASIFQSLFGVNMKYARPDDDLSRVTNYNLHKNNQIEFNGVGRKISKSFKYSGLAQLEDHDMDQSREL